jgi:hypothetical protein
MKTRRLFALRSARWTAYRRLHVVARSGRFNPVSPKVGPQFRQRESRIGRHQLFAQLFAGLTAGARAQVQVFDRCADAIRELNALGSLRGLEKRSEIHWASFFGFGQPTIYHFALLDQDILHVYHFDSYR